MPHNLAWHDWELRTRVQRANREVEQLRRARMASDARIGDMDRFAGGLLAKLQHLAGLAIAHTAESVRGAQAVVGSWISVPPMGEEEQAEA